MLTDFAEATEVLSSRSASIAEVCSSRRLSTKLISFCQVIPVVSTIMADLASGGDDHGVRGLKRELLASMTRRLGHFENNERCAVATLVNPRYKRTVVQ